MLINMLRARGAKVVLLVVFLVFLNGVMAARTKALKDHELEKRQKRLNKPAVKTIEVDNRDVIDCVDIYNQPAFDHASLKNHKIKMRPTEYPIKNQKSSQGPHTLTWRMNGVCPRGTVPIRRTRQSDLTRALSPESYGKRKPISYYNEALNKADGHENALLLVTGGEYYGAKAEINVWNIHVETKEFSASKISILSSANEDASSIQAGWLVHPQLFGDSKTRLFTYWTDDGFNNTGCYNMLCPGFVQVSQNIVLGAGITPLSTYNGSQYVIELLIYKDPGNGDWWLLYGENEAVGYWPGSLFTKLNKATLVEWGGEVLKMASTGSHTTTQMGSGHFPSQGFGKSSYFNNILVVDKSNTFRTPEGIVTYSDKPQCYDVKFDGSKTGKNVGYIFFYGGPGRGPKCH